MPAANDHTGADRLALAWASALSSIWRFTCRATVVAYRRESIAASSASTISRTSSRKFLRASSQVFCESYPRNRPAVLVLPADQTQDHASRISAMEGQLHERRF
jgi:hypothetical protein